MISTYASKYHPIPVMVLCKSFPSLYLTPHMSRGLPDGNMQGKAQQGML